MAPLLKNAALLQSWRVVRVRVALPPHEGGAANKGNLFKGRQFTAEVILWAVPWYLMFLISCRDLELMLADRGISVDHITLFRWIQDYAPELGKRLRPHLRRCNGMVQAILSNHEAP